MSVKQPQDDISNNQSSTSKNREFQDECPCHGVGPAPSNPSKLLGYGLVSSVPLPERSRMGTQARLLQPSAERHRPLARPERKNAVPVVVTGTALLSGWLP